VSTAASGSTGGHAGSFTGSFTDGVSGGKGGKGGSGGGGGFGGSRSADLVVEPGLRMARVVRVVEGTRAVSGRCLHSSTS